MVGDGIREDIGLLAELLQSHAGPRFVFALVELGIYETPVSDVRLVLPSVLAQTTLLERGVVQIDDGAGSGVPRILVKPPPTIGPRAGKARGMSLGEDEFFELLDQNTGMAAALKDFLERAESRGIYPEVLGGLNLKHSSPSGPPFNLGAITKGGVLDTWTAGSRKRSQAGRAYNETLAALIGGW